MEENRSELQGTASGFRLPRRVGKRLGLAVATALIGVAAPAFAQQPVVVEGDERVDAVDRFIEVYVGDDAIQAQYGQELRVEGFGSVEARGGFFYNESAI